MSKLAALLIAFGMLIMTVGGLSQGFALESRFLTHDAINQKFITFLAANGLLEPASAQVLWIEDENRRSLLVQSHGTDGPEVITLFHDLLQADIELYTHEHDSQHKIRFFAIGGGLYLRYHPFQERADEVLWQFGTEVEADARAVSMALTALAWSGYRQSLSLMSHHRLAACFVIPIEALKSVCIIAVIPLIGRGYSDFIAEHGLTKSGFGLCGVGILIMAWQRLRSKAMGS